MALAAVLRDELRLEEVELGAPGPGEVLVRIAGTGICHTDLLGLDGTLGLRRPAVLGHEGAGVVEQGAGELRAGDRVVLTYDSCGDCRPCGAGRPAYCARFAELNYTGPRFMGQASWATHAIAGVRNAIPVDTAAPLELCGPLGCSLQTGAGAVLNVLRPQPGDGLAVFGAGAVGLAAVMAAAALGCDPVVAVDPSPERRALALELGADAAFDPAAGARAGSSPAGGVGSGPSPRVPRVPHVVETVGTEAVLGAALAALESPGTCATLGFRGLANPVTLDQGRLLFGRTLTGVIEGDGEPAQTIAQLLAWHAEGRFAFERLTTAYPLREIEAALEDVRRGAVVKAVLVPGAG